MNYKPFMYPNCPCFDGWSMYPSGHQPAHPGNPYGMSYDMQQPYMECRDYGRQPFTVNIKQRAEANRTYRTAIWTGKYLQVTVMSINPGEDIGLEVHPSTDQFLRVEAGRGLVRMGENQYNLDYEMHVQENDAIMVPAGKWHNLINIGHTPLKLYTIYAPPEHPFGTVHMTKHEAMEDE
ncbi:Mannose-6-phosphate isomerase, cupin superfamily [Lentibacillus persicus]|uniref:Mannose-6-phosphate isomerase, cupin superfamily n=1 Tax=Lentibacillus persicus TaxID=640948 RepID=A0A1I1YZ64_9BACI|nr:cupin domain-containing protein [Lentibacillus persicus]SFE24592.1 Mannose-6-phosphate isomerase, cupin superfamily [Lentibacillus persicus]